MALCLSPEQRRLRAQTAAYERWSKEDPREGTKPARAAYMRRFVDQVDPDRILAEPERERRAQAALKAHMARMALASSRARAKRAAKT
jgi:hypothetical protein